MRIIAGKYGGLRVNAPAKMPYTRPTTDSAREGLFNILQNAISLEGISTLELFAGTGTISFELASRGAADLTMVEKDPRLTTFFLQEATRIGITNIHALRADVFSFLDGNPPIPYDLIFADPPYALERIGELPDRIVQPKWLNRGGWFVLEHDKNNLFDDHPYFYRKRNYGTTIFSIFILQ